jgi:hypothetical protein
MTRKDENIFYQTLRDIAKEKGLSEDQLKGFISKVGLMEAGYDLDPSIKQYGGGPGRGIAQWEINKNGGSNRVVTSLKRAENYFKSKNKQTPDFLKNALTKTKADGTFDMTELDKEQQLLVLLGDFRMGTGDLGDLKEDESGFDLYREHWWQGADEDEASKKSMWKERNSYLNNNRDKVYNQLFDKERKFTKDTPQTMNQPQPQPFNPNERQGDLMSMISENTKRKIDTGASQNISEAKKANQEYFKQNQLALGGPTGGFSMNNNLNEFGAGGTHGENKLGGIPQGMGANGKLNTVEEEETSFTVRGNKFIFSNRVTIDGKVSNSKFSGNQFALGGDTNCGGPGQKPCTEKQKLTKLSNKDINKGREELKGSKDFIGNWIKSDRFKKKFKENLTEIDNNRDDPKYKGWYDNLTKNTVEEDVKKNKNAALNNLSTVIPFSNKNNREDRRKLSDEFSEITNETKEAKARREWMTAGTYDNSSHSLFVLDDHENTATHEYMHSTRLDRHLKSIAPQSDKVNKVLKGLNLKGDFKIAKGYFSDNPFVYKYDTYREKYLNHSPVSTKQVQEQLKKEGIDLNDINYLEQSNEVYPRLMTFRKKYNIKPEDVIDDKKVEEIYKGEGDNGLFKLYSKKQVKEMLNKFANTEKKKQKNTTNTKLT